jgi:hypothetical protein
MMRTPAALAGAGAKEIQKLAVAARTDRMAALIGAPIALPGHHFRPRQLARRPFRVGFRFPSPMRAHVFV